MTDSQLLEQLAATDAYAPRAPLPSSARTRDAAIAEIEWSTDMLTNKRSTPQAPQRRIRQGWLAAAAAFAVVLIAGAAMVFLAGQGDEDVIEPTTTTSAVPTTITTLPPPPVPPMVEAWQRVGGALMGPVVGTFDMTQAGSRLVVVGFDPGEDDYRQNGVIFASDDGVNWERLAENDPALTQGFVLIHAITEGGPGLVAVGYGCEDDAEECSPYATAWTSVDGASWTRTSHDPAIFGDQATETTGMTDVIATSTGTLIAVGWLDDWTLDDSGGGESVVTSPAVWTSPDGVVWERAWLGEGFELTADVWNDVLTPPMHAIAENPDGGLVAVGAMLDQAGESTAAVWTSQDGSAWNRVDTTSPVFGQKTEMTDITWGSDGYVAVGTEDETTPAIWTSPDGHAWARVDVSDQPFEIITSLGAVAALESGYITVGPSGDASGGVTVWTSPDGTTWDRVHTVGGEGTASAVVVADSGIAVSGSIPGADNVHAAVWIGPLFDPEAPPPDPGPPPEPEPTPEEVATGIAALEGGVSCDEIATQEFTYAEALSYWVRYELTDDFDLDTDGEPCGTAYAATEVVEVFGELDALSVHLISRHPTGIFLANGPAVDAGLVCPEGTIDYTPDPESDVPGVLWRWEDLYTCDDGSGTFLLGVDEYIEDGDAIFGVWNIVSGTGEYEALRGGGATDSIYGGFDASTGRMWLGTNEN